MDTAGEGLRAATDLAMRTGCLSDSFERDKPKNQKNVVFLKKTNSKPTKDKKNGVLIHT